MCVKTGLEPTVPGRPKAELNVLSFAGPLLQITPCVAESWLAYNFVGAHLKSAIPDISSTSPGIHAVPALPPVALDPPLKWYIFPLRGYIGSAPTTGFRYK